MSDRDKNGIPYLDITRVNEKTVIEDDGEIPCLNPKSRHVVFFDNGRPYVFCKDGKHFLDGQADDGVHCVGFYEVR